MKITKIVNSRNAPDRVLVYVDNQYCCSIRQRTFTAMNLSVGQEITCDAIVEKEKFFFKNSYGVKSWEQEKTRLNRVCEFIESIDARLVTRCVGFGADSTEFIPYHPEESGRPDVEVGLRNSSGRVLLLLEVTGTEMMRLGVDTFWVRPDKLSYAARHPEQDVWIVLHYAKPEERMIFIKPHPQKEYAINKRVIRNATEQFVEFSLGQEEVRSKSQFVSHLQAKLIQR